MYVIKPVRCLTEPEGQYIFNESLPWLFISIVWYSGCKSNTQSMLCKNCSVLSALGMFGWYVGYVLVESSYLIVK